MCRSNLLWGSVCIALGVAFLIGLWVNGGFMAHLVGGAAIVTGICVIRKR